MHLSYDDMRQNIIHIYDTTILLHFFFLFLKYFSFFSFFLYLLSLVFLSIIADDQHPSCSLSHLTSHRQPTIDAVFVILSRTHTRDLYNRRVLTGDDRPTDVALGISHTLLTGNHTNNISIVLSLLI